MRDNYYVGENISLILQSSTKTLGELTDLAQIFDTIPNAPKFPLPDKYTILNKSHLNHVAYLVEESHRIEIWWIVSPITDPRTSPHQFFLYLMLYPGQEGPFGVFRKKGWAWHGEYAINTESDQYSILKVKLSLTESGV